jgi:hypothetical protein
MRKYDYNWISIGFFCLIIFAYGITQILEGAVSLSTGLVMLATLTSATGSVAIVAWHERRHIRDARERVSEIIDRDIRGYDVDEHGLRRDLNWAFVASLEHLNDYAHTEDTLKACPMPECKELWFEHKADVFASKLEKDEFGRRIGAAMSSGGVNLFTPSERRGLDRRKSRSSDENPDDEQNVRSLL